MIEYLQAENQSFHEQLGKKRIRWTDTQRRRLAERAKAIGRSTLAVLGTVVTPDTLLLWYRNLVAAKYDGSKKRGSGRPRTRTDIGTLVIRMARENPSWGYTRIRGALFNLGHDLARNTIKAILRERGIEPAPERGRHASWHTFVKSHLGAISGADFFTVEVLRGFGLVRCYVFYTKAFRAMLKDASVEIVRLPSRSPNLNSYAERWVRSLREECLNRIIPLGEKTSSADDRFLR